MSYGIHILGLVAGGPSAFDGRWLKEYDPDRRGRDPLGNAMLADIQTTADPGEALAFDTHIEAFSEWRRPSHRWPHEGRYDGKLNRPLTAFTVEIVRLPEGAG